jgi:hypothetical protein
MKTETDELSGSVLQALHDKSQRMAEDLTAIQVRLQTGAIALDQRQALWEDALNAYYTDDPRQDKILGGLLPVALSDLAAWAWLEGQKKP